MEYYYDKYIHFLGWIKKTLFNSHVKLNIDGGHGSARDKALSIHPRLDSLDSRCEVNNFMRDFPLPEVTQMIVGVFSSSTAQ